MMSETLLASKILTPRSFDLMPIFSLKLSLLYAVDGLALVLHLVHAHLRKEDQHEVDFWSWYDNSGDEWRLTDKGPKV